jgi:EmrB/QacA subfamily drug resistance transporter
MSALPVPVEEFVPARRSRRTPGWTLTLVLVALFMLVLDMTIVAVALADIQRDLDAELSELQWVVDAYTLPLAGLLLTAATVGDRIGRRRVFLWGMALFTTGSLACAASRTALELDLARGLQGAGGALLLGVGLPLIGAAFSEPKKRAAAVGAYGATLSAATAVGPLLGGLLVDGPGWRWIFLVNVPVGILALLLAGIRLAESRSPNPRRADWGGAFLLSGGLVTLVLALIRGNEDGWTSPVILVLFAATVLMLGGFVPWELRRRDPMLELRLFRLPAFSAIGFGAVAISATLIASTTYLALYMQNALEYTPFETGVRFLPLTVASFVASLAAAALFHKVSLRMLLGGSLALGAEGMLLLAMMDGDLTWATLIPGFVIAGVGLGVSSAVISYGSLTVPAHQAGMATGTLSTLRQIGVAAGVAMLGALYTGQTEATATDRLVGAPLPDDAVRDTVDALGSGAGVRVAEDAPALARDWLTEIAQAASANGLTAVLLVGGALAALSAVVAFLAIRGNDPAPEQPVEDLHPVTRPRPRRELVRTY